MVKDTGRRWIQSGTLNTVAAAHRELEHFDRAVHTDIHALALAREARFKRAEADGLLGLALTYQRMEHHGEARSHAEQALRLARSHGFRVPEGQALTVLCGTAEAESTYDEAVALGREALAIHRETGHRLGEARTLVALARALRRRDAAASENMRQQALDIFSDVGVPTEEHEDLRGQKA